MLSSMRGCVYIYMERQIDNFIPINFLPCKMDPKIYVQSAVKIRNMPDEFECLKASYHDWNGPRIYVHSVSTK